jgi:hypothetical protein
LEYRLAEKFGMPVSVMKSIITKKETLKWLSYFYHKPPEPLEVQIAVLSAMVANGLGAKGAKAEDFILTPKTQEKHAEVHEMDPNEVSNFFKVLAKPM